MKERERKTQKQVCDKCGSIEGLARTDDKGAATEDEDERDDVDEEDGRECDEAAATEADFPVHERLQKGDEVKHVKKEACEACHEEEQTK